MLERARAGEHRLVAGAVALVAGVVLVAVVHERSRHLAAIIATMPLTAPPAMWIVFSAGRGDQLPTLRLSAQTVGDLTEYLRALTDTAARALLGAVPARVPSGLPVERP